MTFERWAAERAADLRRAGRWRTIRTFDASGPVGRLAGRKVVSFASNDYLGLSNHPAVVAAAHGALDRWGAGATASRLVVGSRPAHDELEEALCTWKDTEAALVFPSGYAANLGVLGALGGPDCLVVSDEINHASLIDGCRLSRSTVEVARHNDVAHVEALLKASTHDRAIVVTDSVFSMDGDEAPVADLAAACERHGALLVLDDAHAVLGPDPGALADVSSASVLRVVTMSKALGSLGGAACGPRHLVDLLVNLARSSIFTTALSPADAAAATAAIGVVRSPDGAARVDRLRHLTERVSPGHPSPIVPIVVGVDDAAMAASARLLERGIHVPAIRPPTVAPGTARLRIALSASHTDEHVDDLLAGLDELDLVP